MVLIGSYAFDAFGTASASGSQIVFETSFAVELFLLLNESDIVQRAPTLLHAAHKMIRTPRQAQSRHELAPDIHRRRLKQQNNNPHDKQRVQELIEIR